MLIICYVILTDEHFYLNLCKLIINNLNIKNYGNIS